MHTAHNVDVIVVGAGISGICAGHYLKTMCPGRTFRILERRDALGGTWDLFDYPGVRSDSDMFTFGFSFRPWKSSKAIAPKEDILKYLWDTAHETGVAPHIRFGTNVNAARFSSATGTWTVDTTSPDGERTRYTCSFLFFCTGYYKYEEGYAPDFPGTESFRGEILHPQHWDRANPRFDCAGKRVVVIGSGATAATMVPALADRGAEKVIMLQRSPGYYVAAPSRDAGWSPSRTLSRWSYIAVQSLLYWYCTTFPGPARRALMARVRQATPPDFDVDTHFNPKYDPWQQRLCLVPDGDFFRVVSSGAAEVVTDHVDAFVENGVRTRSGRVLEADVVVTATGLNLQTNFPMSTIEVSVDGVAYDAPRAVFYKGAMLSDVPNFFFTFGYANASWTLKAELTSIFACRVINHMDARGYDVCRPRGSDAEVDESGQFFDLSSGYLERVKDRMPKQGVRDPWILRQSYVRDWYQMQMQRVDDGVLSFEASSVATRARL